MYKINFQKPIHIHFIGIGAFTSSPNPYLCEFNWGAKEPSVEIQLKNTTGYQAMPFSIEKALGQ